MNLIDVTLACDGNSKLVEVVTVADVSDEDRVGNSLFEAEVWSASVLFKVTLHTICNR